MIRDYPRVDLPAPAGRPWAGAAPAGGAADAEAWPIALGAIGAVSTWRLVYVMLVKRVVDVVVAGALLVLLAPLIAVAMVLIRLESPGPALFVQERIGRGGVPFRLLKLRTMYRERSGELVWFDAGSGEKRHKVRDDPRVTRVGRWLRRLSLDELPQLYNIVRGDMSLIGPRPELPEIVAGYEPWQHERHLVRPGLTGWWQVSGRSDLPMHEHTELDLYYVRRLGPRLDLMIAARTVHVVVRGFGAF